MWARRVFAGLGVAIALTTAACDGAAAPLPEVSIEMRQGPAVWAVHARVASTPEERDRGLMGVRELGKNDGMLFVFPGSVRAGFWMKDTLIPLDVVFIAGGAIVEVDTMTPCRRDPCLVTRPAASFDAALEVAAGAFARAGLSRGAVVTYDRPLPAAS
jgi:uncharacterized membrane protein (UPF0127 family)